MFYVLETSLNIRVDAISNSTAGYVFWLSINQI